MPEKNEQTDAQNSSQLRGTIENKAPKPVGLLPKNAQQLVILGVAVVMVLIMWLTGGAKRTVKPAAGVSQRHTRAGSRSGSGPRFQTDHPEGAGGDTATDFPIGFSAAPSFRTRRRRSARQRRRAAGRQRTVQPGGVVGGSAQDAPPPDPVKEDKKKREYLSLFATNIAFTSRKGDEADQLVGEQAELQQYSRRKRSRSATPTTFCK